MDLAGHRRADEPSGTFSESRRRVEGAFLASPDVYLPIFLSAGLLLVLIWNAVRWSLPGGYAGLYVLMSESIVHSHFLPPLRIGLYGPGGIPFAYPPLALYLMAFCIGILHVPVFDYLRFAPDVFV